MTEHPKAELLRAIAEGKQMQVQYNNWDGRWVDCDAETALYRVYTCAPTRIKPEPKPDVVRYKIISVYDGSSSVEEAMAGYWRFSGCGACAVVKITTSGETGKVSVEAVE